MSLNKVSIVSLSQLEELVLSECSGINEDSLELIAQKCKSLKRVALSKTSLATDQTLKGRVDYGQY